MSVHRGARLAGAALGLVACSGGPPEGGRAPDPRVVQPAGPEESLPTVMAPPPPGWIAFVEEVDVDGRRQPRVARVRTDGTGWTRVDGCPELAFPGPPDPLGRGVLLVCSTAREDAQHAEQLRLAPWGGGPVVELSPVAGRARSPAWSADGATLYLESDHLSFRDLYRVGRAGGALRRLTDHRHGQFEPAPSPDGARLAFVSSRDMNAEIYVSDADGAAPRRLTDHPRDDGQPAWAGPDRLLFLSARTGELRLWSMGADGADAAPVIPGMGSEHLHFAVSPDGGRVALVHRDHGAVGSQIWVVELAGPRVVARLGGPDRSEHPAWSPDGRFLVWDQADGADVDLWVARADGREPRRLTAGPPVTWLPRWLAVPP